MAGDKVKIEKRGFKSLIIPCATVFVSSFCIMVLELVAGRIIARWLGSSLYTWTSVIGVVLAGITIGNYLGGRLADRFQGGKTLAVLFGICSVSCIFTIVLNNFVGEWMWLWRLSWPVRIFLHVSLVFLLPSTLLGTISPVVAKMALDRGLPVGRTVGDIYAWGAVGSIAGTFAAGYYLIALMGTISIIWAIGAVMMVMALLYGTRIWVLRGVAVVFVTCAVIGTGPWGWVEKAGAQIGLREERDPAVLYEDETQYCYVAVKSLGGDPEKRIFVQDKLTHSAMVVGNIDKLEYSYEQIMAAITHRFGQGREGLSFLILGGGGYVFPRYLEKFWPGSTVDVAEIDPGVTKAAVEAFGLEPTTSINTISLDARNYVDEVTAKLLSGQQAGRYDFIYEDALNNYSVPYQLTTRQFNEKLADLLTDEGIYLVELIDVFESGRFLGAFVNTLKETFPFVSVISEHDVKVGDRNTFVVIAAKRELDLTGVCEEYGAGRTIWYLDESDMAKLRARSKGMVLTDDYAPVENLLAAVAREDAEEALEKSNRQRGRRLANKAEEYAWAGNLPKTLATLEELIQTDPSVSVRAYDVMAKIFADSGKADEAVEIYRAAFEALKSEPKDRLAQMHHSFGVLLQQAGKTQDSEREFEAAAKEYKEILAKDPASVDAHVRLGNILADSGDFEEAVIYFRKVVELKPNDLENHMTLIQALLVQGKLDEAIETGNKSAEYFRSIGRNAKAAKIQEYANFLRFKKFQATESAGQGNN